MVKSVSELMVSDRFGTAKTYAAYVIVFAFIALFAHAPILDVLSIQRGMAAKSRAYIPRGTAIMWKVTCDVPRTVVIGDMTRMAVASDVFPNSGVYASREYFCSGNTTETTDDLCDLASATYRNGIAKTIADFAFFFTLVLAYVAFLLIEKIHVIVVIAASISCIVFANVGVAAMSAQVFAVRAYADRVSFVMGHTRVSFSSGFSSIFATGCIEVLATIALIGAYVVIRRRASREFSRDCL